MDRSAPTWRFAGAIRRKGTQTTDTSIEEATRCRFGYADVVRTTLMAAMTDIANSAAASPTPKTSAPTVTSWMTLKIPASAKQPDAIILARRRSPDDTGLY